MKIRRNLYQPILINTALIICGVFALYGLIFDLPLIQEASKGFYIFGRISTAILCAFFFYQVNVQKKQYESQVPLIYSLIIAYTIQGHFNVNGYYMAFMQAVAGFSLFFAMPKKYFYPITIFGNTFMLAAIWTSRFTYSDIPSKTLKFNIDASLGVVLLSIICLIGYRTITLSREHKQIMAEKFLDVGRHFGNFVHELKGIITPPNVYSELLLSELSKESPDIKRLKEIATNLKGDISNLNQKVLSINNLSKNSDEISSIDIRTMVQSVEKHFFSKDSLNISLLGDHTFIKGNEYSVRSILLNLINNSRENFSQKKTKNKSIEILIEPQKITFKDNGGGFSKIALKKVSRNSFFTEKPQGSGMGLFIIKEYMKEFGGYAVFKNRQDGILGVQIELVFSKREKK